MGAAHADPAVWHDPKLVTDISFGIFCQRPADYVTKDADTVKGSVERHLSNPVQLKHTQTIPAIDGLLFGVMGREDPSSASEVIIVVEHPPLGPSGATRESWTTEMQGNRTTFHGYYLGLSDGNPIGDWTITATRGDKTLFSVEFQLVKPGKSDRTESKACLSIS